MKKASFYSFPCPWCLKQLRPNNVVFRCLETNAPDEVLAKDYYLRNYQYLYGGDRTRTDDQPQSTQILDPALLSATDKPIYTDGVLTQIITNRDGVEQHLTVRLCPYCHNPLYDKAGTAESIILSVIGFTKAGKSTYQAALLKQLQDDGFILHNISKTEDGELSTELDDRLYQFQKGNTTIESTNGKMRPLTYYVEYPKVEGGDPKSSFKRDAFSKPFCLTMQDIPGEEFRQLETIQQKSFFISRSDICVFLLDLDNLEDVKQVANNIWSNFGDAIKDSKVHIAMVLYKADLLRANFPNLPRYVDFSTVKDHKGLVPLDEKVVVANSQAILDNMVTSHPDLNAVSKIFSNLVESDHIQWFLANGMQTDNLKQKLVFSPTSCDEPVLWALAMKDRYPVV